MELLDSGGGCSKEIPSQFKDHIQGDQISGSIDAQVAGATVQLQQSIYRLVAKTKYGENSTILNIIEE